MTENPGECDSCGFKTEAVTECPDLAKAEPPWYCELCKSTHAGVAHQYPSQYQNADVLRTICYVGNVILAKMEGKDG